MDRRNWLAGWAVVALVAGGAAPARAADEEEAAAFKLGKSIVEAGHPTGVKHKLKDYSRKGTSWTIEVDWRGGFLDTAYTSKIKVEFKTDGGKTKVASIDYKDDAFIAYNRANLDRLIRKFNDE